MGSKTLANHRANLKAALRWLSGETGLPTRGAPLSSAWARLRDAITDKGLRARLYGLMRFASAQGIPPDEVTEEHVLAYLRYRAETTALAAGLAAHRSIARSWNRCVDDVEAWPRQRLVEPGLPCSQQGPAWESFPESLQRDLETYLASLTRPRRTRSGKRVRASKPSTVRARRAELLAFARKAVATGIPQSSLTSLGALLHPDVARPVLDAYWRQNGS